MLDVDFQDHLEVDVEHGETSHFTALLAPVDLDGVAVTFDALHTVWANLDWLIGEKKANYIAVVKKEPVRHEAPWHIPAGGTDSKGGLLGPMAYLDPKGEGEPEHASKPAAGPRCLGRCAGGPVRYGEGLIA